MSRILLVDDSPHAQRMGERILTEEGYEVVTVSNADSALIRLDDVDPDVSLFRKFCHPRDRVRASPSPLPPLYFRLHGND